MFKNYLKIALRNLQKNKVYSSINVLGLTLGFLCCMLIMLHVKDELSYDKFIPNHENIYRVALERIYPDHVNFYSIIPHSFAVVIQEEVKGVEDATRVFYFGRGNIISFEDTPYEEDFVAAVDSNFYNVFDFALLEGDQKTALLEPNTVVISQTAAQKIFKGASALGKTIKQGQQEYEITGVMEDIPENSHMKLDYLVSSTSFPFSKQENFTGFSAFTYLKLAPTTSPDEVEGALSGLVTKYASGQIERNLGISYADYTAAGNGYNYFLQPLADIHLHSNLEGEMKANGNYLYVYIFISIAVFILVLACINFINLATARSADRAKEVGVRKAMGSDRKQIITQFLMEAVLLTMFSLLIGIVLVSFAIPFFNNLAQKSLVFDWKAMLSVFPLLLLFGVIVGLLAGYYPAFHISKFNTISILKGKLQTSKGNWLRNGLVVFQFGIAIILISGTLIINDQIQFIQSTNLGFDKENVLVLRRFGNQPNHNSLKQEIENLPGVISAGKTSTMPGQGTFGVQFTKPGGGDVLTTKGFAAEADLFPTIGLKPKLGRVFDENFNDSLSLILNESAVKVFFGDENPLGQHLETSNNINGETVVSELTVVGVVDDFNFESLHTKVTPLAIFNTKNPSGFTNFLAIRFEANRQSEVIDAIEEKWTNQADGIPISYYFLDSSLAELYKNEQTSGKILGVFSTLAILIACIGLFGLAAYTAFLRTKEIGVRKVLGASVPSIILLLSVNFAKLVGIAFLIGVPIGWFVMSTWLDSFAFKIDLGVGVFLIAGMVTLGIALVTVSYQAISAAIVNPVKSLKSE
ncbi:putative ABC transport system permease protein [Algoriphagus iocasae]|uniref:Putative ABC transport system permease protein n=1 Tax=Algoriphagus iocasae TaxID=1836499 RepID=A0A841MJE1_9BACT|nr:ABC transporter permease [Algoriphagus iocasae]MBB6327510.1 putative ABC transport system permease protein [Algoriphagus iocasae]